MRGSSSWKAFRPPPGPSRSFSLRVLMPGSDHGGQPDQQGRRQVQDAPADQTYTEYDSVISYEAPLASEDSAAVDSADGSADHEVRCIHVANNTAVYTDNTNY